MSGAPDQARELATWIAPARTALLLIDIQRDFASADGAMGRAGCDLSAIPAAIANAERLARAARSAGVLLAFSGLAAPAEGVSAVWRERERRLGAVDLPLCIAGTPGAAFVGPQPASGDLVALKTRYSAFFQTDLEARLAARDIDTLVICGLTTECCVEASAFDAFHRDFHLFVVGDACAAYGADLHAAALQRLELNCAVIASTADVVGAWAR